MGRALLTFRAARPAARAVLVAACAAALAACAGERPPETRISDSGAAIEQTSGHRDLPCAACHSGALTGTRRAAVPRESCVTSGCHVEGGPPEVTTATATFAHRDHARDGEVALSCAGCHTHDSGTEPLRVSIDACALCHLNTIESGKADDCRLCHVKPQHVALTSQALPIPHSNLPWVETGCVRCHYDVAEAPTRVAAARCVTCHQRDTSVVALGIGTDLHPRHVGVTCTACHEGESHRVRAMSSAVQLVCADCHTSAHALPLGNGGWTDDATCTNCHQTVHQQQQRLLLGVLPDAQAAPSSKFIAGMTCRSCHMRTERALASGDPIRGQAEACAGCHRTEYRQVLDWWLDGTRERTRSVGAYVRRAETDLLGGTDSVRAKVAAAGALIRLVEEAGGQHNLELSDRIFRESVQHVRSAYAAAGRVAPQPPTLGSPAHEGMCSFCHYSPDEPWNFRRMSDSFHREVLRQNP
jgi:predicted Fe-S protein YdhL (DUF1289 family)